MKFIMYCEGEFADIQSVLDVARLFNAQEDVILLSDGKNNVKGVTNVDISDYYTEASALKKLYQHKSTNPDEFELISIIRWCVLSEYVQKNGVEEFYFCDYDVISCFSAGGEASYWVGNDFCLSNQISGGISFWFNMDALEDYVNLMFDVYSGADKEAREYVFGHYEHLKKTNQPGGVCDMTFLAYMRTLDKYTIGELCDIKKDSVFDPNIMITEGWKEHNGCKDIYFHEGMPYCDGDKGPIKFKAIHCSFLGKPKIKRYCNEILKYWR